ncbi:hypothetical protein GC089_07490 [Cellulomonas sp. JZ18]|uniref:hypothetical protein n=1 Tax=Cellulomonas sp. JZ18 TaxID=2654191 RepID=UPI0012D3EA9B|nr:hypothetical protein [Cellulomonas sp. JZ18]QGQ19097.1 hypothetical protein GC089_07490 [Cellulomonas sp. JZ18]
MQPALVPDDVVRLLEDRGLAVVAAVGTDGAWWVAHPAAGCAGEPLEVQVVRVPADDDLRARAARLRGAAHPHLAAVRDVVPLDAGRVAVVVAHVPGPTLAALRAARPPLSNGEAVTVAVPVAQALGALHAAGLTHAAVAADRVVVRPDGFPVLVDVRGVLAGSGTPDGDVRRLVATVLGVLPPVEAQLAADLPELDRLRGALEEVARRPSPRAQDVVEAAFAAAHPQAVQVPDPDALAGAQVALAAGRALPRASARTPPSRRARRPRARRGRLVVVLTAGLVLAAGGTLAAARVAGAPDDGPSAAPTAAAPTPTDPARGGGAPTPQPADRAAEDPVAAAAVDLTRRRAQALADASSAGLADVHVAGSPALARDVALLERLAGARSQGLVVHVAEVVRAGETTDGDTVVAVRSSVGAHARVAPSGERTSVPAGEERTVELVLRSTPDGWRVWDVRAPDAPS